MNPQNCAMDQANYLSFIGLQSCQVLYSLIDDKEAVISALRIIKKWTKLRGVYGFNFGYLNGISIIVMLIKVEQYLKFERDHHLKSRPLVPAKPLGEQSDDSPSGLLGDPSKPQLMSKEQSISAKVSEIVIKFFKIFQGWDYSKPVFVHQINPFDADFDMEQDAQKSAIPVLQPLGSFKCTTFGTTVSARNKFIDELRRAYDISMTIIHKKEVLAMLKSDREAHDKRMREGQKPKQHQRQTPSPTGDSDSGASEFNTPSTDHTVHTKHFSLLPLEEVSWGDLFEQESFFFNHEYFFEIQVVTQRTESLENDQRN